MGHLQACSVCEAPELLQRLRQRVRERWGALAVPARSGSLRAGCCRGVHWTCTLARCLEHTGLHQACCAATRTSP